MEEEIRQSTSKLHKKYCMRNFSHSTFLPKFSLSKLHSVGTWKANFKATDPTIIVIGARPLFQLGVDFYHFIN